MVEFPIMYMNSTFVDWGKEGYFRQGKVSLKLSQEGHTQESKAHSLQRAKSVFNQGIYIVARAESSPAQKDFIINMDPMTAIYFLVFPSPKKVFIMIILFLFHCTMD